MISRLFTITGSVAALAIVLLGMPASSHAEASLVCGPCPDLTPHPRPGGGSAPLVGAMIPGTFTQEVLVSGTPFYLDWGYTNIGPGPARTHEVKVWIDGLLIVHSVVTGELPSLAFGGADDTLIADNIAPGWHDLTLTLDPDNLLFELNETNNTYMTQMRWVTTIQVVSNPSFETDTNADKIPDDWLAQGINVPGGDGRRCANAIDGACALKLIGDGTTKRLKQVIAASGIAGEVLTLRGWSAASGVPSTPGSYQIKVILSNVSGGKSVYKINLPVGSQGWTEYALTFAAAEDFWQVKVVLVYGKGSGTVWFDYVRLVYGS